MLDMSVHEHSKFPRQAIRAVATEGIAICEHKRRDISYNWPQMRDKSPQEHPVPS